MRTMQVNSYLMLALALGCAPLAGCSDSGTTGTTSGTTTQIPPTDGFTATGQVKDAAGAAIAGATVSVGNASATTDATGAYSLAGLPIGSESRFVYEKAGFAPAYRNVTGSKDQAVYFEVLLHNVVTSMMVDVASADAMVPMAKDGVNFGALEIPQGSLVGADGKPPAGPVQVDIAYIAPSAVTPDSTPAPLVFNDDPLESFGMTDITITGSGTKFDVAPGKTLKLTLLSRPEDPATSGLFSIDPATGSWKEEGSVQNDGTMWTAQLPHLSWYNLDIPSAGNACVNFVTLNADEQPVPNFYLQAYTEVGKNAHVTGHSDKDGKVCAANFQSNSLAEVFWYNESNKRVGMRFTPTSTVNSCGSSCDTVTIHTSCKTDMQCGKGNTCRTNPDTGGTECRACPSSCLQGQVVWNDLSGLTKTQYPTQAAPFSFPLATPTQQTVKVYRSNGTTFPINPFSAPMTTLNKGFTSTVLSDTKFEWLGIFKYINIDTPNASTLNAGTVTFDFGAAANTNGVGWYYIVGVTALGFNSQGPLTITSSLALAEIGSFDAWGGAKPKATYDAATKTITGTKSKDNTQMQFYLIPQDQSVLDLVLSQNAGAVVDTFGLWVGAVNVGETCAGGGCALDAKFACTNPALKDVCKP